MRLALDILIPQLMKRGRENLCRQPQRCQLPKVQSGKLENAAIKSQLRLCFCFLLIFLFIRINFF
jgi:hypothetical protein